MTQNEVSIIKNAVLDATEAYVDARLANADFVKTQIGVVIANPTKVNNKYHHTVQCNKTSGSNGVTYTNVLSVGNIGFPRDSVVFLIAPNAQYSNQFILGKLDSSPANIVGGEIHIGEISGTNPTQYYFNVNSVGKVEIKKGSININDKFYVDDTGNLFLGGTTTSNANFYVTNAGKVTIKSGSINLGGTSSKPNFSVTDTGEVTIRSGSILLGATGNNYNVNINNTGIGLGYNSTRPNNYNFTVDTDGNMNMYQGSINLGTSAYTTSRCAFSVTTAGYLESVSGKIGGFTITRNSLGDPLGTLKAVGMISQDHIYVVDGTSSHVKIYDDEVNILNGKVYIKNGSSEMNIDHANIYSSDQGSNVVWHSEIRTSSEGYLMWA